MYKKKPNAHNGNIFRTTIYLAAVIPLVMASQALGGEYYMGGLAVNLNTQLSIGSSWRAEKQDPSWISDTLNGNGNNGNVNFKEGDAFSQVFKGSNELQVSYENYGAFVRAKYWYDAVLENDDNLDDSMYHDLAKFSGAEIFDAFIYGEFEILDMPLDVRLGKQVVSWGESTFILGSVNVINSYDLSAFNRPGAKIKEAVIPVGMAYANLGLTDNLSAEAFYQLEYSETIIDGCGTYFAFNDYAASGCDDVVTPLGDLSRDENDQRHPGSDGQFGVAFRYNSTALDTEFGFYAMNIHSRIQLIGGAKNSINEMAIITDPSFTATVNGTAAALAGGSNNLLALQTAADQGDAASIAQLTQIMNGANVAVVAGPGVATQTFYSDYPEDMKIVGLSFATTVASVALSGEISHSLDLPMQINAYQIIGASTTADTIYNLTLAGTGDPVQAKAAVEKQLGSMGLEVLATGDGEAIDGYRLFDVTQLQLTAVQLLDRVLGADQVTLIGEAGYTFVNDYGQYGDLKFDGFGDETMVDTVTESAWGYRLLAKADYANAVAGIALSPEVFWSHDVEGVSSISGSGFVEGNERLGVGLNADYLNTYNASLSYTRISGGGNNTVSDRDFVSVSMGLQF